MRYFLVKTEPSEYSINDLKKDIKTVWDGVHNYAAIGFIKQMQVGDRVFIYHSMSDKKVVGLAQVVSAPFQNTNDPRFSWAVELAYTKVFDGPTLAECKKEPLCANFALVKQSRLSVMPVPDQIAHWMLDE